MKKEYKTPMLSIINVNFESLMQIPQSGRTDEEWANSKKVGRTFEDDEAMPAAPKKFWDDEE